ncbi:MAG: SagB/ThcOx family dehydrogenase [bacterium]
MLNFLVLLLALPLTSSAAPVSHAPREPIRGVDALPIEQRRAFLRGTLSDWRTDTDDRRGIEAPPMQKPYRTEEKRLDLVAPSEFKVGTVSVMDAIRNRCSRRDYSSESFSLEELSYLLWATQGMSKAERDVKGKPGTQYRTVPSGGARHPFETYLIINRVAGVASGLYRYLPLEHQLLLIKEDATFNTQAMASCYGQTFIGSSAVVFVWAAIPARTEWHYGSIAQKLIAIEAGHLCQNLYLAAESIHGGVCAVMGYDQARMDALLGLDGKEEFVIYLAATGKADAGSGVKAVPSSNSK